MSIDRIHIYRLPNYKPGPLVSKVGQTPRVTPVKEKQERHQNSSDNPQSSSNEEDFGQKIEQPGIYSPRKILWEGWNKEKTYNGGGDVVLAYDHSPSAQIAYEIALHVAQAFGSQLRVVYVTDGSLASNEAEVIKSQLLKQADPLYPAVKTLDKLPKFNFIKGALPSKVFIDMSQQNNCDLLLVGSSNRSGIERFFLGSISEDLVREAHCPVIICKESPRKGIQNILVPLDDSPASLVALNQALKMSEHFHASITVFHANENLSDGDRVAHQIEDKLAVVDWQHVDHSQVETYGDFVTTLCEHVESSGIDMVVMGTYAGAHERSVTEEVVRQVKASVMVVHPRLR